MDTLRYSVRVLRRNPLFSAALIGILAAGIAANTIMFSIVSGVLLRPLPFRDPARLVTVSEVGADATGAVRVAPPTFLAWRERQSMVDLTAMIEQEFIIAGGEPVHMSAAGVSANFFAFLGEPLYAGRAFTAEEDRAGAAPRLILGHALCGRSASAAITRSSVARWCSKASWPTCARRR